MRAVFGASVVLVLLCGCAVGVEEPTEDDTESSVASLQRPPLIDEMRARGSFIEDFLWTAGYTECTDCTRVVRSDFSTPGEMTQHIYHHWVRGPGKDGVEACQSHWSIAAQPAPGFAASDRIILQSVLLDTTCGWPLGDFPPSVLARVRPHHHHGKLQMVAWWPGDDAATFPGWDLQGTHTAAIPMVPCHPRHYLPHRKYCMPSCSLAEPENCSFPTLLPDPPPPLSPGRTAAPWNALSPE